ncbi:MAG: OmpH family outer membrane protein [Bacteroidales bacterium]|nr:OmpH family outer membrane protein [Bacteroidales bacterium]
MEENTNINQTEQTTNQFDTQQVEEQTYNSSDNATNSSCSKRNILLPVCSLIVACAALIVAIIGLCKKGGNDAPVKVKAEKVVQSGNLKIAYINTDTIMAKYTMAVEMQKDLMAKQASIESSLKNKLTQLQKEEQEYLKTGQNLTLTQQQAKEKDFQQREQQLSQAMQQQPVQFQQEVAQQNEKLLNAVLAFVKDYNAKHDKYNVIMSVSRVNGPTLYIDEGMDITDEIVKGLNEEYENVKKNK